MTISNPDKHSLYFISKGIDDPFVRTDRQNCIDRAADLNRAVQCLKTEPYLFIPSAIASISTDLAAAISANTITGSSLSQTDINALVTKFGTSSCTGTNPSPAKEECCFRKAIIDHMNTNMNILETTLHEQGATISLPDFSFASSPDCSTL